MATAKKPLISTNRYLGQPPISPGDAEKIMHISLPISKETVLMESDSIGEWASNYNPGNNFSISVGTDVKEDADRLLDGLSGGGKITLPIAGTF